MAESRHMVVATNHITNISQVAGIPANESLAGSP
jgi:hypothetical protein